MTISTPIQDAFAEVLGRFLSSPIVERIRTGECDRDAYAGILSQIFHQTGWNPQLQAMTTMHFRGEERAQVGRFLAHARSEVGHDEMAKSDLIALGYEVSELAESDPLPETAGLIGYAAWSAQWRGPAAYLGYLFFLEFTPTTAGARFADGLSKAGIPDEAMSFLKEHIVVDEGHNRLMEQYLEGLIRTPEEQEVFLSAVRTTAELYERMLTAAANAGVAAWGRRQPVEVGP
ncbi:MAG: iron-containing redox enzyme family protein [Planctomycetota bacterium]